MAEERAVQFLKDMKIKTTFFGGFNKRATLDCIRELADIYENILQEKVEEIKTQGAKAEQLSKETEAAKLANFEEVSRKDKLYIEQLVLNGQRLEREIAAQKQEIARLSLVIQEKEQKLQEARENSLLQHSAPVARDTPPSIAAEDLINEIDISEVSFVPGSSQVMPAPTPTAAETMPRISSVDTEPEKASIVTPVIPVSVADEIPSSDSQLSKEPTLDTLVHNKEDVQSELLRSLAETKSSVESVVKEKEDMMRELDLVRQRLAAIKQTVAHE